MADSLLSAAPSASPDPLACHNTPDDPAERDRRTVPSRTPDTPDPLACHNTPDDPAESDRRTVPSRTPDTTDPLACHNTPDDPAESDRRTVPSRTPDTTDPLACHNTPADPAESDRGTDAAATAASAVPGRPSAEVDVIIVGGGPAGLSAALNLGRARASVLLVDAGRPRNAATLRSHGFLTRDGVPPLELRKLARAELSAYPNVTVLDRTIVTALVPTGHLRDASTDFRFIAALQGRKAGIPPAVAARSVLLATGLRETLPDIPSLRAFYGMTVFSCAACDAWELQDRPLALIGQTRDLAARARLIARWTDRLTVFTHGADVVDTVEEAELTASGIRVERTPIADLEGDRGAVSAVRLIDGRSVPIEGGFVRPLWHPVLDFAAGLRAERDPEGHLVVDASGRTSVPGLYGAGDAAAPGPQQLIVAAGQGARAAAVLVHDLIGVQTAH